MSLGLVKSYCLPSVIKEVDKRWGMPTGPEIPEKGLPIHQWLRV